MFGVGLYQSIWQITEMLVKSSVDTEPCSNQHLKMAYFVIKQRQQKMIDGNDFEVDLYQTVWQPTQIVVHSSVET